MFQHNSWQVSLTGWLILDLVYMFILILIIVAHTALSHSKYPGDTRWCLVYHVAPFPPSLSAAVKWMVTMEAADMISTLSNISLGSQSSPVKTNDGKSRKFVSFEPNLTEISSPD